MQTHSVGIASWADSAETLTHIVQYSSMAFLGVHIYPFDALSISVAFARSYVWFQRGVAQWRVVQFWWAWEPRWALGVV